MHACFNRFCWTLRSGSATLSLFHSLFFSDKILRDLFSRKKGEARRDVIAAREREREKREREEREREERREEKR